MKISGRTIKQRLYGLRKLPSDLKRARYFRGHGVHSPYVYSIVRQVFMVSHLVSDEHSLYEALLSRGVGRKRATQLQNLACHCHYERVGIDCAVEEFSEYDMVIATTDIPLEQLPAMAHEAQQQQMTLCVMSPSLNRERDKMCKSLVEEHPSTSVDNRGYLLLFNNHLPKQIFKL